MPIANYTTSVTVEKSMSDVIAALTRRGVARIATVFADDGSPAGLEFTMKTRYGLRDFALPIRTEGVLAALISQKVEPRYRTREHAARVAWRIAGDWLRAQSALIDSELVTLDEVMFPWMIATAKGQTTIDLYRSQQKAIES